MFKHQLFELLSAFGQALGFFKVAIVEGQMQVAQVEKGDGGACFLSCIGSDFDEFFIE